MAHELLAITDRDRAALTKMTASRRTPRGQSTRAHIVLTCAEGTVAEAARRCGVSFRTAAKWKQRYERCGIAGLADAPRTGRPAATDGVVHRALTCVLREPPARGWTTRSIADSIGLSQSTVCRIRRDHFPKSAIETGPKLAEQSAILAFVYVGPGRRVLAFHSPPTAPDRHRRRQSTTREIADAVETVLCAALVPVTGAPSPESATTIELLRRATGEVASNRSVTVAVDFEPDNRAKHWLRRQPAYRCRRCSARALAGATSRARGGRRRSPAARTGRPTAAYPRLVRWARARVRMVADSIKFWFTRGW